MSSARSCLIPIYTPDGQGTPVPVRINLAHQKFCGGAARVQSADGAVLAPLSIIRGDVLPAVIAIERCKIDYVAPKRVP